MGNSFVKWLRQLLISIYPVYWEQLFINIYLTANFWAKLITSNTQRSGILYREVLSCRRMKVARCPGCCLTGGQVGALLSWSSDLRLQSCPKNLNATRHSKARVASWSRLVIKMNETGRSQLTQPHWSIFASVLLINIELWEVFLYGKKYYFKHGDNGHWPSAWNSRGQ